MRFAVGVRIAVAGKDLWAAPIGRGSHQTVTRAYRVTGGEPGACLVFDSLGRSRPLTLPAVVIAGGDPVRCGHGPVEIGASVENRAEYSVGLIPESRVDCKQQRTHTVSFALAIAPDALTVGAVEMQSTQRWPHALSPLPREVRRRRTKSAMAVPTWSGLSSWTKWIPATVVSVWFGHVLT